MQQAIADINLNLRKVIKTGGSLVALKDRVTSGLIGGISAGAAMNITDWLGYSLGMHRERLLDWAAVVIMGRLPVNPYEIVFAQLGQIFFAGFLGILFALILLKLASGNYIIKSWIYGIIVWFGIYTISIALRLPTLETHTLFTSISHFISASLYGLVLGLVLNLLDKPLKSNNY